MFILIFFYQHINIYYISKCYCYELFLSFFSSHQMFIGAAHISQ